jgi:hypothetical protein
LQRNLPQNYPYDNIYSLFPLTCPDYTKDRLDQMGDLRDKYDYERPKLSKIKVMEGKGLINHIMKNPSMYRPIHEQGTDIITDVYG